MSKLNRNLCDVCGLHIEEGKLYCSLECEQISSETDVEDDFEPCSECDGHDACFDFGCAYKLGLAHLVQKDVS
jgi:hypothetical protein